MINSIKYFSLITQNILWKEYKLKQEKLEIEYTKKNHIGDITIIIYPLIKKINKPLNILANEIGICLIKKIKYISSFKIINGFLNLKLNDLFYIKLLIKKIQYNNIININNKNNNKLSIMIEFSSPNTNKPLHIGHLRNILLGNAISSLFKFIGRKVITTQIFNDRGIHICKSMLAWQLFGNNKHPNIDNIKGDHFVGNFYIKFNQIFNQEVIDQYNKTKCKKQNLQLVPIMIKAKKMLQKWEKGDLYIRNLWEKMNNWVYQGFNITYNRLGIKFDINEYESNTYLLGKKIILNGLKNGIFFKKYDGSIWIDLKKENLGEKLLLRADGTSVYITQDIGTVINRFNKYPIDTLIYVVGKDQDYHFQVLFTIIKKLNYSWANKLFHLSYEMVTMKSGKMQSRLGTIINIDNLMDDMYKIAYKITNSKLNNSKLNINLEKNKIYEIIAQGALKYYILKIDPKKSILFNKNSAIDFKGDTGTYIQYTYVRICSIKKKYNNNYFLNKKNKFYKLKLTKYERNIIITLDQYYSIIEKSALSLNPSLLANYSYNLSKKFNDLYQNINIINNININQSNFRVQITFLTGKILKICMNILGISLPDYM